ncbi:hypothetical protein A0J61_08226 [Choanephora cucurbitarum]|uniref:Uncharacterized protein n=1 Tax=Choanephora cucurbitarum TaxID=101091 RepID=A0A1C7N8P7_9FUNG|nr:hypothetical protein A0J61_08226 [Choanephora cucurbitarum]
MAGSSHQNLWHRSTGGSVDYDGKSEVRDNGFTENINMNIIGNKRERSPHDQTQESSNHP